MFRMQLHLIAVLTTRCHRAIDPKIAIIATAVSTAFRIAYTMTRALIQAEWLMALLTQLAMVPIIQARAFVVDISIRIARFTPRGWRLEQRIVWPCPTRGELLEDGGQWGLDGAGAGVGAGREEGVQGTTLFGS